MEIQDNKSTNNNLNTIPVNNDVFENLYKVAEKKRKHNENSQKHAYDQEIEKLRKECTFKPNLRKTQGVNSNVNSKIFNYKPKDSTL